MTFGVILIAFSGFLLGGVWSVWRLEPDGKRRTAPQLVMAAVLLGAALLALAAGILRLV